MGSSECTLGRRVPDETFLSKCDKNRRKFAEHSFLDQLVLCDVLQGGRVLLHFSLFAAGDLREIILLVFSFFPVFILLLLASTLEAFLKCLFELYLTLFNVLKHFDGDVADYKK